MDDKRFRIKRFLVDRGIKQKYVAEKTGIKYDRFRKIICGQLKLTADEAERIDRLFGKRI